MKTICYVIGAVLGFGLIYNTFCAKPEDRLINKLKNKLAGENKENEEDRK